MSESQTGAIRRRLTLAELDSMSPEERAYAHRSRIITDYSKLPKRYVEQAQEAMGAHIEAWEHRDAS